MISFFIVFSRQWLYSYQCHLFSAPLFFPKPIPFLPQFSCVWHFLWMHVHVLVSWNDHLISFVLSFLKVAQYNNGHGTDIGKRTRNCRQLLESRDLTGSKILYMSSYVRPFGSDLRFFNYSLSILAQPTVRLVQGSRCGQPLFGGLVGRCRVYGGDRWY